MTGFSPHFCRRYLPGFLIAGACFFLQCIQPLAGGTSTTDNPMVIGTIIGDDGRPAQNTRVVLLPENYDPLRDNGTMVADTTDGLGWFALPVTHGGIFNLQAVHLVKGTRLLDRGIVVALSDDLVKVYGDTLKHPGAVMVDLPDSIDASTGYLYVPGTTVVASLGDAGDRVLLDSVPAGTLPAICYTTKNAAAPTVLRYNVRVFSGSTAIVMEPHWKYSAQLFFNTTSSGAGVAGNVVDFPVLVRLTDVNFAFSQAQTDGGDIRFTKENGLPLSFEIERWDAAGGQAEIWVKVDTVYGNTVSHYIIMYWGNSAAAGGSSGAAVFDTAAGFRGVWHLGEITGNLGDATVDRCTGSRRGNQVRVDGVVGYGQVLSDSGDYTDMGNVCNPDTTGFSVCAWIKAGMVQKNRTIVAKSYGGTASPSYGWLLELDKTGGLMAFVATGAGAWGSAGTFVLGSTIQIVDSTLWHHVAAVFDRSDSKKCRLYIDGTDVSALPAGGDIAGIGALVNSAPLRLGADANGGCPWKGSVDECSISSTVRPADWIRLCYMNQKQDDRLVTFR